MSLNEILCKPSDWDQLFQFIIQLIEKVEGSNSLKLNVIADAKNINFGSMSVNDKALEKVKSKLFGIKHDFYISSIKSFIPSIKYCLNNHSTPSISLIIHDSYNMKSVGSGVQLSFNEIFYEQLGDKKVNKIVEQMSQLMKCKAIFYNVRPFWKKNLEDSFTESMQDFLPCAILDINKDYISFSDYTNVENIDWEPYTLKK
ncbi:hypothetical protein [Flammeovirga sp. EKP202]|uniref:hypothetical protein n=1 Tax=Flammeovirga sp. EKP202 TaxID=2770592 RepID=UPI00165F4543|nr:hypothetical protein [Flammeovirga sp. EKP202]MBD0403257.1 hypothetical protein [Flammeovirga sp. EKP202]